MTGIFILVIVVTMGLSFWASMHVQSTYKRYLRYSTVSGKTGAQVAAEIMRSAGINDVEIVEHHGMLSDHYDPSHKRLALSHENYHGTSPAALGVAAHEAGHAIQHKAKYAPLEMRMAAVGITSFASQIIMILPLVGMFTGFVSGPQFAMIMALGWGIMMLFNLITLPVEFDASRRARMALAHLGFIRQGEEATAVRKVLDAAAWTYVAAFITSLVYFLWHILPLLMGRRDSEH